MLLSLRSDYYGAHQNDRTVFDASEHVDVLPPARDVLSEIIRRPALTLGAQFESDDMVERVADATESEPGALPLLSDLMPYARNVAPHAGAQRRHPALVG